MSSSPATSRGAGATRVGTANPSNQDAWVIAVDPDVPARRGALYAVADGVRTVDAGRWAADLTCERIGQLFRDGRGERLEDLLEVLDEIDWELRGRGEGKAACTLAMVWIVGRVARIVAVGDSPVFRIRKGQVARLTEARRGRGLKAWMGMGARLSDSLRVIEQPCEPGDAFMVVTDGVDGVLRAAELGEWWKLTGQDPERTAQGLVGEVGRRQGADDATVVVAVVD
jgi:serine/threonine protein phosphatase PrpC